MTAGLDGLISGRYRLGSLLGSGGSASVFEAVDESNHVTVALKLLHPHLSRAQRAREAFFVEARAAERLRHPNVVAVLGAGVHDPEGEPLAWIALERAAGITLAEWVELRGPVRTIDALTVADGVLRALEAAHSIGLMHRDVSPANIMVDADPSGGIRVAGVHLLDFGLADAAGRAALGTDVLRSERVGTAQAAADGRSPVPGVLGSANYMSPEQASGDPVDERGDLYQVGAVLHFSLTGRAPFLRTSITAVLRAHIQSPPPVPSVLRSGIPRDIDRLVVKAMLKSPDDRFASAALMRTEVLRLIELRTVPIPSAPTRVLTAASPATRASTASYASTVQTETTSRIDGGTAPRRGAAARSPAGGTGAWITALLTVGVIAVAWVFAAGSSPGSSVAAWSPAVETGGTGTGTTAPPTTTATSPGARLVPVPQLAALSLADARTVLAAAGLNVGALTPRVSAERGDTVLEETPAAGTSVAPGAAVDLVVASGSNTVPRVAGLSSDEAVAAVQAAGFAVLLTSAENPAGTADTVLGSAPAEDTELRLGSSVTIFSGRGHAATPAQTETPHPTSTPTPSTDPETRGPDRKPAAAIGTAHRARLVHVSFTVQAPRVHIS